MIHYDSPSHEIMSGSQTFPPVSPPGSESWITRSLNLSKDEVEEKAGLDHAMYLEFLELSMRTDIEKKGKKMKKKGRNLFCCWGGNLTQLWMI